MAGMRTNSVRSIITNNQSSFVGLTANAIMEKLNNEFSMNLGSLGKIPAVMKELGLSANADKPVVNTAKVNPAIENQQACFLESGFKKHFMTLRIMNSEVPELVIPNGLDGFKPNPEFQVWYAGLSELKQSAIQGNLGNDIFDSNMMLLGIKTARRIQSEKDNAAKEQKLLDASLAVCISAGYVCFKATDLQSAIDYAASLRLIPDSAMIMAWQAQACFIDIPELPAFDGTGLQYDSFNCSIDNPVVLNDWKAILPSKEQARLNGNGYLLFMPDTTGMKKEDKELVVKQSKENYAKRTANLGEEIHKAWQAYHAEYQSKLDAQRLAEEQARIKQEQAQQAMQLLLNNPELMAQLLGQVKA